MKLIKNVSPKDLKEIAANIRDIATTLEANNNLQCLQSASLKTKKVKGRLDLDIAIKFSLVDEGEIKEVGDVLEGIKLMLKLENITKFVWDETGRMGYRLYESGEKEFFRLTEDDPLPKDKLPVRDEEFRNYIKLIMGIK